ncbi:MAG: Cdc6/Cdc18 family protein, partial [Promethearchaeota archaeon]
YLNDQDSHLLLVLDELSYLINRQEDSMYSLATVSDDSISGPQRISIIGIVRDPSCLNNLDPSTLSTFQRNIIHFKPYSKEHIFNILKHRAEISIKNEAFNDEIINMISELVLQNKDIRYGLNILWRAGKIAESKNLKCITPECVRLSNQDSVSFSTLDSLEFMSSQKLITLLSIIQGLKNRNKTEISFNEFLNLYNILCESLNEKPISYSQLWNFLQQFKKENLISVNVRSNSIKGRKEFIHIKGTGLYKLEAVIIELLNSKGISFENESNK